MIPRHVPVTISLSGRDEIVNARNVKAHVEQYQQQQQQISSSQTQTQARQDQATENGSWTPIVKLLYWEQARHADCIMSTRNQWQQFKQVLLEQELMQIQQQQQQQDHQASVPATTTATTTATT